MKYLVILVSIIFSSICFAGPGHSHGHRHSHGKKIVSEAKVKSIGMSEVKRLVGLKKLDSSWEKATFDKAEKKKFKGKVEWLVTYNNNAGVKGKKLYVFLSVYGDFIAANFTGR